ncbi:MAG: hypothetical protein HOH65_22250 [Rhodospirillaceae bacterium]|nr:hypothetical protein [Rhodospirillaceae bacterium]
MIARTTKLTLEFLAAIVAGAAILAAVIVWRLAEGPIPLTFLTPYITEALTPEDGSLSVEFGALELDWRGWSQVFDISAQKISVGKADGSTTIQIPSASVRLSATALVKFDVAPVRIIVEGPKLRVHRDLSGRWGFAQIDDTDDGGEDLAMILDALAAEPDGKGVLGYLKEIEVSGATIRVDDKKLKLNLDARDAALSFRRTEAGLQVKMSSRIEIDGSNTRVGAEAVLARADQAVAGSLVFEGLPTAALAAKLPVFAELNRFDTTLGGTLAFVGKGLERPSELALNVVAGPGRVALPELFENPHAFDSLRLEARYASADDVLILERFSYVRDNSRAEAKGELKSPGGDGVWTLTGRIEDVPVSRVPEYWSSKLGTLAWDWVMANLENGQVPAATVEASGRLTGMDPGGLQLDTLGGRVEFTGVTTHFFRPLPPIVDTHGYATYGKNHFDITLNGARLMGLAVESGQVEFYDLDTDIEKARIEAVVRGPISDALKVLDHEPLGYAAAIGLDPKTIEGSTGVRGRFEFPMTTKLQPDMIMVAAAANMRDVKIPDVVFEHGLDDGVLTLDLNGRGMTLKGEAKIAGNTVDLNIVETFRAGTGLKRTTTINTTLDAKARGALGLALEDFIDGDAVTEALVREFGDGRRELNAIMNLREARLMAPRLDWEKPVGAVGTLRLKMTSGPGLAPRIDQLDLVAADLGFTGKGVLAADGKGLAKLEIDKFVMAAKEFEFAGKASFAQDGSGLTRLDIGKLKFAKTEATGTAAVRPDGTYLFDLAGPVLDLKAVREHWSGKNDEDGTALEVKGRFDQVIVNEDITLNGVRADAVTSKHGLESIAVSALAGNSEVQVQIIRAGDDKKIRIRASDASALLKDFELFQSIEGGVLEFAGTIVGEGKDELIRGTASMWDFSVIDAPLLTRLLLAATLTGLVELVEGSGIGFSEATAELEIGEESITVRDALAYGPSLGISAEGTIGRTTDTVSIEGMVVPAYGLSRLIDRIPILGKILTGGKREGLLAGQYFLTDSLQNPTITVNPLTAFTPGFLRNLVKATSDGIGGFVGSDLTFKQREGLGR